MFHRLLKISGLPVWYTQGFNPHIYLSFSCPLSLGQESLCESCEVKTERETIDGAAWQAALQPLMPRGITITKVARAEEKVSAIAAAVYEVTMPLSQRPGARKLTTRPPPPKSPKRPNADKRPWISKRICPGSTGRPRGNSCILLCTLPCGSGEALNLNPALLMQYLQGLGGARPAVRVLRTICTTRRGGTLHNVEALSVFLQKGTCNLRKHVILYYGNTRIALFFCAHFSKMG